MSFSENGDTKWGNIELFYWLITQSVSSLLIKKVTHMKTLYPSDMRIFGQRFIDLRLPSLSEIRI